MEENTFESDEYWFYFFLKIIFKTTNQASNIMNLVEKAEEKYELKNI